MRRPALLNYYFIWILLAATLALAGDASAAAEAHEVGPEFPPPLESYQDQEISSVFGKIAHRAKQQPFNIIATVIFFCAIVHTFVASKFLALSHRLHRRYHELEHAEQHERYGHRFAGRLDRLKLQITLFHFLGEVEAVFGIWLIPLGIATVALHGIGNLFSYIDHVSFTEPIFVVAIMTIASSRPVLRFAEWALARVAALGAGTPAAWWVSILTIGPLLGSFITEPAAMTICAILLVDRFYKLRPSMKLRYATLGLLFVNISVGGTLTHFAAPPVVMVSGAWDWDFLYMLTNFGWKAAIGIVVANLLFFTAFRGELLRLQTPPARPAHASDRSVPKWITFVHIAFIAWTVFVAHHPALVVLSFLFFLAFVQATERNQDLIQLRGPLLVGFFLAALVIHGGCQRWWIAPVLSSLTEWPLMIGATVLTAFNDNAAITYLASRVPDLSESLKYAVVAGAVTGGGLTVIANAPNPAGQTILQSHFGENGVNPAKLCLAALAPTIIMGAAFMLLP